MIWVETERPSKVEDVILPERIKRVFMDMVSSGEIPNMTLAGSAGCGKTTVALALCKELGYDYYMVNGSGGLNVETLRNDITSFASTVSFTGAARKVVIIDEIDGRSSQQVQEELRGFIEAYSNNCSFILTCNNLKRVTDPIQSRCDPIVFDIKDEEIQEMALQMFQRLQTILAKNNVSVDDEALIQLILKHAPDWRRVINIVQKYSRTGTIDSGVLVDLEEDVFDDLIQLLKGKKFKDIRTWVGENSAIDPVTIFTKLYKHASEHVEGPSIPDLVLILSEYQYKSTFAVDQEINTMAALTEILSGVKFK